MVTPDRHVGLSLPPDTIAEGVRRLGWLALVYSIGHIAGPFARLVLSDAMGKVDSWKFGIPDAFGVCGVVMGFGMFAVARSGRLSAKRLLDLGLVFEVAGALGIAVREFWQGLPQAAGPSFFVPGECVWLVAYPLLVPNTPGKVLVASLLAASTGPVVLGLPAAATATPVDRPLDAAAYFLTSSYLCAILAYLMARVVYRLNLRLKDARDIGSYQLVEQIGEGGMGQVWRRSIVCWHGGPRSSSYALARSEGASARAKRSSGASSTKRARRLCSGPSTRLTFTTSA